jgi:hypothetical protein
MDDLVPCCIGIIYLNDVSASVHSELCTARARTLALHNSDATGFNMISFSVASELLAKIRTRQCRFPTILFSVVQGHCRVLYIIPAQSELI